MQMSENKGVIPAPTINVTPLIDVLLVLLIIFMVAAPLRPHRFLAKVPAKPHDNPDIKPSIHTLVVSIELDRTLKLNHLSDMGTVDDLSLINAKLISIFAERTRNRAYRSDMLLRFDVPEQQRIEKTVFIKAPRSIPYGEVARVLDGLKSSGADPIGLQLDDLK
jgi:biopolymer transport protein ExbD